MLMPKRVKYRRVQRGRLTGKALRGNTVSHGDFGLQATEPAWITSNQIEAARIAMTRYTTVRMKKAKELINLYGEDVSIARIAELCGIVDPAVFSKNFKKFYGISPKQYMQTRKKG